MQYYKLLPNGLLDDNNLKSEYERGYVDCWNELNKQKDNNMNVQELIDKLSGNYEILFVGFVTIKSNSSMISIT